MAWGLGQALVHQLHGPSRQAVHLAIQVRELVCGHVERVGGVLEDGERVGGLLQQGLHIGGGTHQLRTRVLLVAPGLAAQFHLQGDPPGLDGSRVDGIQLQGPGCGGQAGAEGGLRILALRSQDLVLPGAHEQVQAGDAGILRREGLGLANPRQTSLHGGAGRLALVDLHQGQGAPHLRQ